MHCATDLVIANFLGPYLLIRVQARYRAGSPSIWTERKK
jgi:hypothetical protein